MDLAMLQYIEINLFGVVILLTMWFFIVRMQRDTQQADQRLFVRLLLSNIGILLADIVILVAQSSAAPPFVIANYGACLVFFTLHGNFGCLWLSYCIKRLFPERTLSRTENLLLRIPFLVNLLLTVTSPWTHIVFFVDSANVYHRGDFLVQVMLLSYLYWAVSTFLTAREWRSPDRPRERSLYITLLFFPLPTVVGNFLQLKYYGLSIVWVCSALSLLVLFINIQNDQVSRDVLTGLFNRRQANKHIEWELQCLMERDDFLFVILADVDQFKDINDRFGHLEGDQALRTVAQLLRKSFRSKDFIGRFGGDEFLVVGYVDSRGGLEALMKTMRQNLAEWNQREGALYRLQLSAGFSLYGREQSPTLDQLISEADRIMYQEKQNRLEESAESVHDQQAG